MGSLSWPSILVYNLGPSQSYWEDNHTGLVPKRLDTANLVHKVSAWVDGIGRNVPSSIAGLGIGAMSVTMIKENMT